MEPLSFIPELIAYALLLLGIIMLAASLYPTLHINREAREYNTAWRFLFFLNLLFIVGYAVYGVYLAQHLLNFAELTITLFMAAGSGFVLMVSHLGLSTIREIKRVEALERHRATHDDLTNLPNRGHFASHIAQLVQERADSGKSFAIIMLDLDRFKVVNDTLGHHYGDLLLQEVGKRLHDSVGVPHVLARLGGDEFGILVEKAGGAGRIMSLGDKIHHELELPFNIEGYSVDVGVSIGIAFFPRDGREQDVLLKRAEIAMYEAKKGPTKVISYHHDLDTHAPTHLSLVGELRHAIEHDELIVYYQPQLSLTTYRVEGAEALVRWPKHPRYGRMMPDEFIPLAEQSGVINILNRWVLDVILRDIAKWKARGLELTVSANLSVKNLLDPAFTHFLVKGVQDYGLKPNNLKLEITESAVMSDPALVMDVLSRLVDYGIDFSIDDFGTGYSSLAYLKRLPASEIKIDKSFVMDMAHDENDEVIVRSTIDLAHNMSRTVVAEGVENRKTLMLLAELGCDFAQGYYIHEPVAADAFLDWVERISGGSPEMFLASGHHRERQYH
ncbi:MAG: EAL domain-containing protein [Gammaproteobacteria bacterium]|jgi:diguanylate cyclase (GGDEF)-like protein